MDERHLPAPERWLAARGATRSAWERGWMLLPAAHAVLTIGGMSLAQRDPDWLVALAAAMPHVVVTAWALRFALRRSTSLARQAHALARELPVLVTPLRSPSDTSAARRQEVGLLGVGCPFADTGRVGPAVSAAAVLATVLAVDKARIVPWWLAAAGWPLEALTYLPFLVLAWTFLAVLLGVDRLGRGRFVPDAYRGDPSLGLRPVGRLVLGAYQSLALVLVLVAVLSATYTLGLAVAGAVLVLATAGLALATWRLHRQMAAVRAGQVARARARYAAAFHDLARGTEDDLVLLQRQAPLLSAAEGLERRAGTIEVWPFGQAVVTRIVLVASGVLTSVSVRFVLGWLGM